MSDQHDKAYSLYCEGVIAFEAGNIKEAITCFEESTRLDPHFKTHHRLAEVYHVQERSNEEGEQLALGYNLNQNNDKLATHYAQWLISESQYEVAKTIVAKVLLRNATYGPAKRLLDYLQSVFDDPQG